MWTKRYGNEEETYMEHHVCIRETNLLLRFRFVVRGGRIRFNSGQRLQCLDTRLMGTTVSGENTRSFVTTKQGDNGRITSK